MHYNIAFSWTQYSNLPALLHQPWRSMILPRRISPVYVLYAYGTQTASLHTGAKSSPVAILTIMLLIAGAGQGGPLLTWYICNPSMDMQLRHDKVWVKLVNHSHTSTMQRLKFGKGISNFIRQFTGHGIADPCWNYSWFMLMKRALGVRPTQYICWLQNHSLHTCHDWFLYTTGSGLMLVIAIYG